MPLVVWIVVCILNALYCLAMIQVLGIFKGNQDRYEKATSFIHEILLIASDI